MCVKIFIEWPQGTSRFERRAQSIEGGFPLEFYLELGTSDSPRSVSVTTKNGGCGCPLVENPGPHERLWRVKAALAPALAQAVTLLRDTTPFTLRAAWLGVEQPQESSEAVPLGNLAAMLGSGGLIPGRSYHVG